jgi:glycosyltransferase involved in cell wall biosynthesis
MKIISGYYMHKPGGFCKRLYRLLEALANAGHEVHYLSLDAESLLSKNVCHHRLSFPVRARSGLLFWFLFVIFYPIAVCVTALRIGRPDKIVVFGAIYSALFALTGTVLRVPLIVFVRSLVTKINVINRRSLVITWLSSLIERLGLSLATRIVAMSATMKDELIDEGASGEKIVLLSNEIPLPPQAFKRTEHRETARLSLLVAGVFDARKNTALVIKALERLEETQSGACTVIFAGCGPEVEVVRAYARKTSYHEVLCTGWVASLYPLFELVDLYVHPALHEGVSNAVLEALSAEVPVLVSDIPEHKELFSPPQWRFSAYDGSDLASRLASYAATRDPLSDLARQQYEGAEHLRFAWAERAINLIQAG